MPPKLSGWKPDHGRITRLLLLRHGEVHHDDRKALYGQRDVRLSELGELQSRETGAALKGSGVTAVYSSDLVRAAYLGKQVAEQSGVPMELSPALRERFFGDWQGRRWDDLMVEFPELIAKYEAERFSYRVPGGAENFLDVKDRVLPVVQKIVQDHPGQTVALTAHSGPVRIILADALGLPLENLFQFGLDYCSMSVVEYAESGRVRVELLNSTHHLTTRLGGGGSHGV